MNTPLVATPNRSVKQLGALRVATIVALVGGGLALSYLQAVNIGFDPILSGIVVLALIFAGLVASGRRWTPLLGTLWSLLVIGANAPYLVYDLSHPALFDHFAFAIVFVALGLVGIVAGVGATIQHERSRKHSDSTANKLPAPRWFGPALGTLVGLCLGAILVSAIGDGSATTGVNAEALAQLPALTALPNAFDRTELRAKVGETVALRLENGDAEAHSFDIDAFDVHAPLPAGTSSLALFRPSTAGTYTFYCSIPGHREAGMEGTLVVEP